MARYVDVEFKATTLPTWSGLGHAIKAPPTTLHIELDSHGLWSLAKNQPKPAYWEYYVGGGGGGKYEDCGWTFMLYDPSGTQEVMELRKAVYDDHGHAFGRPFDNGKINDSYLLRGKWRPSPIELPHTWVGFLARGSAGAGIGVDAGYGGAKSMTSNEHVAFFVENIRFGAVMGVSGGAAFVFATGFATAADFAKYKADPGFDWTLSIGAKASALFKGVKIGPALQRLESGLGGVEEVMRRLWDNHLVTELHGVGKTVISRGLIDTDYQNIAAFDIPMLGVGAEAGVFYNWPHYQFLRGG